ncbi:2-(1,2-epoxy-1,2-dihydrophenyl)acetyl-CoA isomerase [Pseudomonas pohangensis]|uniref:2-(1,2-epoxy-1,2-dihydrophenyl)acetyl-CoA isomerase n=1 Tax=Pseudomonas pohangensis TaxID=364197 RepID=A0A1H2FAF5_9PSED|nr:enoyl-CoA hydratase-related protein [Pseudomonas pohangensis]SDU04386.1 2-(1,2-epoxy-1,2-dihydrophenyl)acetyl-CoA isomerase [Pseudomonas pohangensis]
MSEFQTIKYSVANRVATIRLNRPEAMNAISQKMRLELKQAIDTAEASDDVRVVIISAEGRGFCSGTDLSEGLAGFKTIDAQIQQEYMPVLMGIHDASKLYIASVHGACAGIGAALAMTCDLAVMADDAFLYLAFAGLSLVPDGGMSYHLVNALGYKKAMQLFAEAGRLPALECEKYGLVNKVVAPADLASETRAWAQTLAEGAPIAQRFGKQIMRAVHDSSYREIAAKESGLQNSCMISEDCQSAIKAFFQKQKPVFRGV